MGIRFYCPNGHKLNVKTFLAGKRGICPECDARFVVPNESGGRVEAIDENEPPPSPGPANMRAAPVTLIGESAADVWHARTALGEQHGPTTVGQVRSWIAEGKVDQDSWVWKVGWLDWQRASDVFPELAVAHEPVPVTRPAPFVAQSLTIHTADDAVQSADVVSAHRRMQRQRRERIKSITLFLGGMVFILLLVLLIVLLR